MPKETPITRSWRNLETISSQSYTCGYCGNLVAPDKGLYISEGASNGRPLIQICSHCSKPTLWDEDGVRYPSPRAGKEVAHVPKDLNRLYQEARDCISVNANTAVVHVCRTAIAHIAVIKGADEGKTFKHYVQYLRDNHYIPQGSDVWVDTIRDIGNVATHELNIATGKTAMTILEFVEMLLRITFEYPHAALELAQPPTTPTSTEA